MDLPPRRFTRHIQLVEIGALGQAKIAAAEVPVGRGLTGWVEARYLEAAGVGRIAFGTHDHADVRFDGLDPVAREVALGAHAAVVALKNAIR